MTTTYHGFHGTLASLVEPIKTSGIQPSDNPDDWLGEGTYFFIDGLDDPMSSATRWARCKAWDKERQEFMEAAVAVVEVVITVDEKGVFDLREPANARCFHRLRQDWLASQMPHEWTHLPRPAKDRFDSDLFDRFKIERSIAALIGSFHILFSLRERHFRLDSRIPNVAILCLTDGTNAATVEIVDVMVSPVSSSGTEEDWA